VTEKSRAASGAAAAVATARALRRFTTDLFVRAGMSAAHAATVADVLVWANLRGIDSHGVMRIPMYLELIELGLLDPKASPTPRMETAAVVVIEAGRAAGPLAMTEAMRAAVQKAREAGVGLALVRGTTHTAALGYYTLLAAGEGLAAIAMAASGPFMAYHGARTAGVSTNPISIAVPGDDGPLVLDMATGVVGMGKLTQARQSGQAIPEGWALDSDGNPTTDSRAAQVPLPVGGPKGSGLSLMIECLTSLAVSNAIIADALAGGTYERRRHKQNGLALAIDLPRFCDPATFRREVARLVTALKGLPPARGVAEILMPGERGRRTLEQRTRDGIPIARPLFDELERVAHRLGVTMFPSTPRP